MVFLQAMLVLFMRRSVLAMEGIIAITGIIYTDFCGEIGLMMHNVTMTDYKVLDGESLAQFGGLIRWTDYL